MTTDAYPTIDRLRDAQSVTLDAYAMARRRHVAALALGDDDLARLYSAVRSSLAEEILSLSAEIDRALTDPFDDLAEGEDMLAPAPAPDPTLAIFDAFDDDDLLAPTQV